MPDYIKQTSRTILFEEFSRVDGTPRMDFLLKNNVQLTHLKVKQELTVKSFDEFMKKFDPKYYEYTSVETDPYTGEEYPRFFYSTEKPVSIPSTEHRLVDQPFYKSMMSIYRDKGESGSSDFGFDFKKTLDEVFDPKSRMEEAKDIRAKLAYNFNEYLKLEANGGSEWEKEEHISEINRLRKRILDDYMSQSQFDLIPLIIADTKQQLEIVAKDDESDSGDGTLRLTQITFDSTGTPMFIPVDPEQSDVKLLGTSKDDAPKMIADRLSADFDKAGEVQRNKLWIADNPESTAFMKNMLISVFAGKSSSTALLSRSQLESNLHIYEAMYRASQQEFSKNVVALVEKILNVKAFFDHAGEGAELIVSNCNIKKLIDIADFNKFIVAEGQEKNDERIWFAVIPAVDHKEFVTIEGIKKAASIDDDIFSSNENGSDKKLPLVGFETLKSAVKLLGENDIITFYNFKGCNKTSSASLSAQLVKDYKEANDPITQSDYSDHVVFCYPNFTVLPERESNVKIGNDYIKLPSVYLDASYIAAGLTVHTQIIDNLRNKGFECSSIGQPVRFDFEAGFDTKFNDKAVPLAQIFATKMNRESILSWSPELVAEIGKDGGFGFCFSGDEKWYDYRGKTLKQKNAYVFKSRTLAKDKVKDEEGSFTGESRYRPIFKTLVKTYFNKLAAKTNQRQIRDLCEDYMRGNNKKAINNVVYSPECSSVRSDESVELKNSTLNINYDRDNDDFNLNFVET